MGTNKNKKTQFFSLAMLVFLATPVAAGLWDPDRRGIKRGGFGFYAGPSVGVFKLDVEGFDSSDGATMGLLLGIEERGWAIEGKWLKFRTNEDVPDKTSDVISSVTLGYRTSEKKDYFKFKLGTLNTDDTTGGGTGRLAGLAYGWVMKGGNRLELEYEYSDQDVLTLDVAVHMISLQYLFGSK